VPLFILPGIICYVLYPHINPDEAYLTMVTNLFPPGMKGLIIVVLVACLISTIGASLNSVSTVFTMDIYVKKYNAQATNREIIRVGRIITVAGAIVSVAVALAIDLIKGLDLFNVFQSVLGFLAPPMTVAFLFGVLWKRTTSRAINCVLTIGTAFCLLVGILYLWVYPSKTYTAWPHFLLLSFYLFLVLSAMTYLVSVFDKKGALQLQTAAYFKSAGKPGKQVWTMWGLLIAVMLGLYIFFNGH
jgi:SSS family solute:Na+ symporter